MHAIVLQTLVLSGVKFGAIKSGNADLKQFPQTYGHNETHTFLILALCLCMMWEPPA